MLLDLIFNYKNKIVINENPSQALICDMYLFAFVLYANNNVLNIEIELKYQTNTASMSRKWCGC